MVHPQPHSGAQQGDIAPPLVPAPPPLHEQPQPVASSSRNPQLGPDPFFRYPTPNPDQVEEELPPYWETENVPLGPMLDRLSRKGYGDMRTLVDNTLPPLGMRQKPKHIIEYAKTTRQAVLKYLAVLRWKTSVDLATAAGSSGNGAASGPTVSFPTPHSNGESNDTSPTAYPSKGKHRGDEAEEPVVHGKVTDARRIQQFLEHQNAQHDEAIKHVRHVAGLVETLRERNADLLTALTLRSTGSYPRFPTALTESFIPRPPLNSTSILSTLERLDEHLLYRLRCCDYLPPELVVLQVKDGRAYVQGGGPLGWLAQLSVVGFEDDSRWWLTGLEWAWASSDGKRTSSPKAFSSEERQQILDLANMEVLDPRPLPDAKQEVGSVDSPLVRIYNFLQHLSLAYQLETLCTQALTLSQGRWRQQLLVDMDRNKKELRLRYWIRPRPPAPPPGQQQAAVGKRSQPPATLAQARSPLVGGVLTFSLAESAQPLSEAERVLREAVAAGMEPVDRAVRLEIGVKWEVGEAGTGGGLKAGDAMDASGLKIDSSKLSMKDLLTMATRAHASHLARSTAVPLLTNERLALDPLNLPRLAESESATRPLALIVPLPAQHTGAHFSVSVSATSGLIEIDDVFARDGGQMLESNRSIRAKLATASVNDHKTRLADDLYRLISAVIMEDVEDHLRQLGLHPSRRVALRTHDLAKTDLHPTSTVFVPLPVSQSHHFVCKITPTGIAYELLKLLRVPMENGAGLKLAVGDRTPIELSRLVERRKAKGVKRVLDDAGIIDDAATKWEQLGASNTNRFQVNSRDLRDMFYYCNALVAQTIVEQQLKDRGIPYTTHFPDESDFPAPHSRSALAGMVPNICVNASDLFKDGRTAEVASPKVFLVINDWWKGTQCGIETIVRLRHRPSVSTADTSAPVAPASSSAARAEGIKFDQATSTVRFRAPTIARCVPDFLEQWERLSKVIVVAGEVNRLNKTDQFHDLRMLSFDLCTATLQYAPGYQVAITYTPMSDSYEASFFRSSPVSSTPAVHSATPVTETESSPHQIIAPLLSHYLNEVSTQSPGKDPLGSKGKQFIQLLRSTLPLLLEAEALRAASAGEFPILVVRSVTDYRLVWDSEGTTRYALDVALTADATHFLISDATLIKGDVPADLTCGPLTPIPSLEKAIARGYKAARAAKVATPSSVGTPAAAMTPAATVAGAAVAPRSVGPAVPPAIRLDNGTSLLCTVQVLQDVLKAVAFEVETAIASK